LTLSTEGKKTPLPLSRLQRDQLAKLEPALRACMKSANLPEAERVTKRIVGLLGSTAHRARLLQSKNWLFECALEAGQIQYAISGFIGIQKLMSEQTRTHLEATALLGICYLRSGKIDEAKKCLKEAFSCINNIPSARRRQQFQKRFITRIEQECILSGLPKLEKQKLDVDEIHSQAILLIQAKTPDEISEMVGLALPGESILLLKDVRNYAVLQVPDDDRKLLMPSKEAEKPREVGKRATAALKRVAWRSLCSADSEVYKLWSASLTAACNGKLVTVAIVTALSGLKIGNFTLAAAISALAMKFSAEVFCETFAPDSVMIHVSDKK
jgi:hypothetical protein